MPEQSKGPRKEAPVGQAGLLSAATTFHIYQDLGPGDSQPQNMPGTEWKTRNLNSFLWGLIRQDLPVTNCRLTNGQRLGLEEVRIGQSRLQVLATFLTLGAWMPMRVSWRCCRPPSQSGILD
jgi:hypothetical protein